MQPFHKSQVLALLLVCTSALGYALDHFDKSHLPAAGSGEKLGRRAVVVKREDASTKGIGSKTSTIEAKGATGGALGGKGKEAPGPSLKPKGGGGLTSKSHSTGTSPPPSTTTSSPPGIPPASPLASTGSSSTNDPQQIAQLQKKIADMKASLQKEEALLKKLLDSGSPSAPTTPKLPPTVPSTAPKNPPPGKSPPSAPTTPTLRPTTPPSTPKNPPPGKASTSTPPPTIPLPSSTPH